MCTQYVDAPAGKIEARKMKEGRTVDQRQPAVVTTDVEDFCETFERTVKPVVVSILMIVDGGPKLLN